MNERTVGAALVGLLAAHGVEQTFGIPGVHTLELFRGLREHGVRHLLNRHEQGAVFAADGYARVTGRPGVALLISGPGLTNAATPIAQAHHDSIPLLVVAAVARGRDERAGARLHDLPDQLALARSLFGFAEHVADAEALPEALARAFASFAGRPRPAYLELPLALLRAPAPALTAAPVATTPLAPDPCAVVDAARVLGEAQRPLVLAGGGARDAGEPLRRLAERLDAPVVTTLNGKGALSDRHPLALGTSLTTQAVLDELSGADAVLAVGTEFCATDYYYLGPPEIRGAVVRVDVDADELGHFVAPTVGIQGDAGTTLCALADTLPARDPGAGAGRADWIRRQRRWWSQAEALAPVLEAVAGALPEDAIVTVDSCQLGYAGQSIWPAHRPRSWLVPHGYGTLGPSLPMAVGAAVAAPDRPVVAVIGDGGLQYTMEELATIAAAGLRVTVLLWDNDGYGEMRDAMAEVGMAPVATDAVVPAWGAVARGLGCDVLEPTTLAEIAVPDGPTVVHLRGSLVS